jgi:MFS family permease
MAGSSDTAMHELMRHRDFRLLMIGQTLSMFGDTAMLLTLGMWAKDLSGSNAVAGSVFVALGLPTLLAPLGGLIIDRFRRRKVMIVVDLLTAVALLALLFVHDRHDLWIIFAVAAAYGASLVTFQSARSALLASMLQDRELGQANGSLSTVREALRLIGPAAGAGLYAWLGGQATALLDAATFMISAAALLAMRVPEPKPARTHGEPLTAQLSSGLQHVRRTPILRVAVVCVVTAMLALGLGESVFFAVVDQGLHKPVTFLGVLQSAMGVGAIAGGVLITLLISRTGERRPVAVGLALVAIGTATTMVPSAPIVALGMVSIGAGLPITVVCITTLLQRHTPAAIQGRVFTTFEMLTGFPQVASIAVGAALVGFVDFHILLTVMASGLALAAVYAFVRLREPVAPAQPAVVLEQGEVGAGARAW